MNMFRKNKKGFTLIELIVVIAILAILAAIAIPTFVGVTQKATDTVVLANARTIVSSINAYNALYPSSPITSTSPLSTLKSTLDAKGWWPGSLTDDDAGKAITDIVMTGSVASLKTTTTSSGTGTGTGSGT